MLNSVRAEAEEFSNPALRPLAAAITAAAAQDAANEWKKTTDSIGQGLTDSLFRAFESGKGFFTTLWDGIKHLFKTTVLKLALQPVQGAISGVIGSVLGGFGGPAAAAGGGGGLGSLLSGGTTDRKSVV